MLQIQHPDITMLMQYGEPYNKPEICSDCLAEDYDKLKDYATNTELGCRYCIDEEIAEDGDQCPNCDELEENDIVFKKDGKIVACECCSRFEPTWA